MKKLLLILVLLATVFGASPTGPGTFLLKRTAIGQPVDLFYFDSVWNVGSGLRRSGDTIYLDYSGVLPGTYGDATHVPQVTVDSFGRVVNVTNVTISGGGGGGGTVTSVGLALPSSVFSISGSPVVGSGTLTGAFVSQAPNTAFMGPASTTGPPTFRAILPGDISFLTDSITAAKVYALSRIHDSLVVERTFDTTVARAISRDTAIKLRAQIHDTADSVRAYSRARIHDTADVLRDSLARRGTEATGLWYFPSPYISIASSTTFSVAPVRGQVVNTTGSPGLTRVKIVNFAGVSGVTPTDLTTAPITYLLLDSNGALVQQPTVPTLADVASNIYLGSVNHPGLTTITSVAVAPDVASRPQDQLNGLWKGIGYINRGVTAYPNGANLSLNISGGDLYGDGIGWANNPKTPVTIPVGPYIQVSMRLRTRSSTTSASTIYIDPANWDNGGTLTAVGGGINSATNQRIFITPAGQVIVAYGQQVYGSLAAAVAGLGSETFVVDPVTNRNLQLLGTLSVIRTATALNNTAQAIILNASKFGELSAGSAGTATTTMQGAYDNSTPPQILTAATRGALTLKRGSANDTDAVIAVQNGAGTTTATIRGNGYINAARAILTTTADAPVSIAHNLAGAFTHPFQAFNSGMIAGNQYNFDFGQSASTNNAGNFGFKYVGAGSTANYVTLGIYGANDLMTITAAGVPKFSGLATAGFVRANASGQLSSSPLANADLPASGVTAGTYGSATTSMVGVVDSKGILTGASSVTITPAWSSVTAKPTTLSGYGITDAQPLDADLTAVAALTGTGYAKRTATTPTWAVSTTIPASDVTGLPTSLPPSGSAGGDLGGTYPNPTVQGLKGVSWPTLANGVPRYNGGVTTWDNSLWNQSAGVNKVWATPDGSLTGPNGFRSLTAADLPSTISSNTTGSAATLTTSRSISMTGDGSWSVSFNGGANVSGAMALASIITAGSAGSASQVPVVTWDAKGRLTAVSSATITPAAIGAQAAGTYLTPSNVSGAAGQIAFFSSANAVGGSSRAKYAESASSTSINLIGGTAQSEITMAPPGTRMTHIYAASGGAGFKETDLDGTSSPNWPIAWAPGAGGMLELGRPTTMASKLYFADNAGAYIIGGRNSAADPYFYITSANATTAGIRLLTSNAGTGNVALSAEAGGAITLPILAGATTRIATISAAGQVGATSWAYDGPWLSLANGGTVTGATSFTNDLQLLGNGVIRIGYNTDLVFSAPLGGSAIRMGGASSGDYSITFPIVGNYAFGVKGSAWFDGPIYAKSSISMVAGTESGNVAPAGYVYVTITTSGTTVLPTPSAGTILIVQRIGGTGSYYVKPPSGVTIAYTDLGGVARQMTNSATNGLNIGGASGVMMFVGGTSSTWGLIGAWPQGS